jgi:SAM-dependent methyltransferase
MNIDDLGVPDPRLRPLLDRYPPTLFTDQLHRSCELAELYTLELTLELLRGWSVEAVLSPPATTAQVAERLGFAPSFLPALDWLLRRAAAAGALRAEEADGETVYAAGALPVPRREELRRLGLELDPGNGATLDLLDAAAETYPLVAAGRSGDEAILGPARAELWARYFDNRNPVYAINNRVAATSAADRLPAAGELLVAEVGAGGGSGSLALIEQLSAQGTLSRLAAYQITEPSAFLRRRAERALRGAWPDLPLRATALDVDGDWSAQDIAPGSLDLVFGVNVMHVARNLDRGLRGALAALRPGGWLVIGECLRPLPGQALWPEFIFKLLDGFNRVETDPELRPTAGFLTPEQWLRALDAAGFVELAIEPDLRRIRDLYPRFLTGALCGRRPPNRAVDPL